MPRFIARPVVVEAFQFNRSTAFMPEAFRLATRRQLPDGTVEVITGDGVRVCGDRDWIVRGPDGLFTVLREATFETMFEEHAPRANAVALDGHLQTASAVPPPEDPIASAEAPAEEPVTSTEANEEGPAQTEKSRRPDVNTGTNRNKTKGK